ncbi:hypothetical protein ABZ352_18450 [Streptomyces griseofuscus]|uniref:hypothetical protein n=1 Tax=Streptomyces griseofuscus TaxID=146922 RepID=UPI0034073F80
MDYAYAVKALPPPADPAAADPAAAPPPDPQPPQQDDARPWAGDLYDEGDETDPAQAYAAFSGPHGEQAWLDKAEDGTLTGWVRDDTGQVWRYSDVDAWAIDVDDAGMTETGGTHGAQAGQDPDAAADDPAVQNAAPLDFAPADDVVDPAADPSNGQEPDPAAETEQDDDPADDEEDEDPKVKKGGKP